MNKIDNSLYKINNAPSSYRFIDDRCFELDLDMFGSTGILSMMIICLKVSSQNEQQL